MYGLMSYVKTYCSASYNKFILSSIYNKYSGSVVDNYIISLDNLIKLQQIIAHNVLYMMTDKNIIAMEPNIFKVVQNHRKRTDFWNIVLFNILVPIIIQGKTWEVIEKQFNEPYWK